MATSNRHMMMYVPGHSPVPDVATSRFSWKSAASSAETGVKRPSTRKRPNTTNSMPNCP